MAEQGIEAEVIDVATLKPIDMETILTSVEKTGRCVIVHEAPKAVGVGAEISAQIAEYGLDSLVAPIQRVTGFDIVVPYPRMEAFQLPTSKRIIDAAHAALEY